MENRFTIVGKNGEMWERICADEEMVGAYIPKWRLEIKPEYRDIQVYGDTVFAINKDFEIVTIDSAGTICRKPQFDINGECNLVVEKVTTLQPMMRRAVLIPQYKLGAVRFKGIAPYFVSDIVRLVTLDGRVGYLKSDGTWLIKELFDYGEEFDGATRKQGDELAEVVLVGRYYVKGRVIKRKVLKFAYLSINGEFITEFME